MLLVSHEPKTIAAFCDRALLLDQGRIILDGPPEAVADRYLSLLTSQPQAVHSRAQVAP
jgi:lipopolysaccharide transport system ATP-binding protein